MSSDEKSKTISSCTSCRVTGSATLLLLAGFLHSSRGQAKSPAHKVMLTVTSLSLFCLAGLRAADRL